MNRFPTRYPAASQNDLMVRPGVYSYFYPLSRKTHDLKTLVFLLSRNKKNPIASS
jgi:hypothetical protein